MTKEDKLLQERVDLELALQVLVLGTKKKTRTFVRKVKKIADRLGDITAELKELNEETQLDMALDEAFDKLNNQ